MTHKDQTKLEKQLLMCVFGLAVTLTYDLDLWPQNLISSSSLPSSPTCKPNLVKAVKFKTFWERRKHRQTHRQTDRRTRQTDGRTHACTRRTHSNSDAAI